jgi:hypothetical protein
MSNWLAYDNGNSIGQVGAEGGVILLDEEHGSGGRMTLKQGKTFISVSCHIYGWIDHTRFFNSVSDAKREHAHMQSSMTHMLEDILAAGAGEIKMWEAIAEFVRRFP